MSINACPSCHKEPELCSGRPNYVFDEGWFIVCKNPECTHKLHVMGGDEKEVIEKWNNPTKDVWDDSDLYFKRNSAIGAFLAFLFKKSSDLKK